MTDTPKPREYFVPVFNLTTRKLTIFRQSGIDPSTACQAARRRFLNCRVYAPRDARPTSDEVTHMETIAKQPSKERSRLEWRVGL